MGKKKTQKFKVGEKITLMSRAIVEAVHYNGSISLIKTLDHPGIKLPENIKRGWLKP
jgi:hypothetical protein